MSEPRRLPVDVDPESEGALGGASRLGYGAVLLLYRLLITAWLLLWIPYAEPANSVVSVVLPTWYALAIFAIGYCLYSVVIFAASGRNPRAHALGSFLDIVLATVLIAESGAGDSPFYGVYLTAVALGTYHFGLTIGLLQGLISSGLWLLVSLASWHDGRWVGHSYQLAAPIATAFLAGLLRHSVTSRASHDERKATVERLSGRSLGLGLLVAPRSARTGADADEAWELAGFATAAAFRRAPGGALLLCGFHRVFGLGSEIGELALEPPCGKPGARLSTGALPEWCEPIEESFGPAGSGEWTVIVASDADGPFAAIVGLRRRGAGSADSCPALAGLLGALDECAG